jgi:hypothetical protein
VTAAQDWPDAPTCIVVNGDPVVERYTCKNCGKVFCERTERGTYTFRHCGCPYAATHCAIRDLAWKATPYGQTEDGDTAAYIVPKGAMHRLIGAAQGDGLSVALRAWPEATPTEEQP